MARERRRRRTKRHSTLVQVFRADHDVTLRYPKYGVAVPPLNRLDVIGYEPPFGSTPPACEDLGWTLYSRLHFMSSCALLWVLRALKRYRTSSCLCQVPEPKRGAKKLKDVKRGAPKLVTEKLPLEGFGTIRPDLRC